MPNFDQNPHQVTWNSNSAYLASEADAGVVDEYVNFLVLFDQTINARLQSLKLGRHVHAQDLGLFAWILLDTDKSSV